MRLSVIAIALALTIGLAACGGDDVSQEDVDKAVSEAVSQAQQQQTIKDLQEKLKQEKRNDSVHGAPTGTSTGTSLLGADCGNGVRVNENTSCPFAGYVAEGYRAEGPGVIRAYSPATDDTYAMTCEAGDPAVCRRGGNNAVVYIYD